MNTNQLRAELAARGMTQGELAAAIGISPNSLSRKLNGRREFRLSEVLAIANALDLKDPQTIFFGPNVPTTQQKEDTPCP